MITFESIDQFIFKVPGTVTTPVLLKLRTVVEIPVQAEIFNVLVLARSHRLLLRIR